MGKGPTTPWRVRLRRQWPLAGFQGIQPHTPCPCPLALPASLGQARRTSRHGLQCRRNMEPKHIGPQPASILSANIATSHLSVCLLRVPDRNQMGNNLFHSCFCSACLPTAVRASVTRSCVSLPGGLSWSFNWLGQRLVSCASQGHGANLVRVAGPSVQHTRVSKPSQAALE